MIKRFPVGTWVRLTSARTEYERWPHIYKDKYKLGVITCIYDGNHLRYAVTWKGTKNRWYYSAMDITALSVVYDEDHLKEKDIL